MSKESNKIICKICGRSFKFLNNTHLDMHGFTIEEYKNKYGGEVFSEELLKIQKDNREKTIKERYTSEQIRYLKGQKALESKIKKYGSKEKYYEWYNSVYKISKERAKKIGEFHKKYWENLSDEEREIRISKSLEKRKKTNLERYGVEFPQKLSKTKEKCKETLFKKYGDRNYKNKEKIRESLKRNYGKYSNFFPRFSQESQELFTILETKIPCLKCQYATNGKETESNEHQILFPGSAHARFLDFYAEEHEKWIEFDEEHHKYQKNKDLKREKEIFGSVSGISLFRVDKKEFLKNKEQVVNECIRFLAIGDKRIRPFFKFPNITVVDVKILNKIKRS